MTCYTVKEHLIKKKDMVNDEGENSNENYPKLIDNSLKALKYPCFFLQNRHFVLLRSRFNSRSVSLHQQSRKEKTINFLLC